MAQEQQNSQCCIHPLLVIKSNHGTWCIQPIQAPDTSCPGSLNPYDLQGCWPFNTWIKNVGGVHIISDQIIM